MRGKLWALVLGLVLLAGCKGPSAEVTGTPLPEPTGGAVSEISPIPDRGELTGEDVERINEAFIGYESLEDGLVTTRPVNGFFLTHYADVKEMDLGAFLAYYADENEKLGPMSGDEREALGALPCFEEGELEGLMNIVPLHRISRASVDETLKRYAGVTTEDLTNRDKAVYLPGYEIYYTFTSDFGPGAFVCEGGRVEGNTAALWTGEQGGEGWREELTVEKEGEKWYIRSFLRVPLDREKSLDAFLLGLTAEEVAEVSNDWGLGEMPEEEQLAELLRTAAQNRAERWDYGDEGTVWGMTVRLQDGTCLDLGASLEENIVKADRDEKTAYFQAPALYWLLRTEYDSGDGTVNIDQTAYETYREAVEGYLTGLAWDPAVGVRLTGFVIKQESKRLGAKVWNIGTELTTDPPERAVQMVGNGYVDSRLRMHPISSDGPSNLLVVMDGEVLGFRDWLWLDNGGLEQYATVEELRAEFGKRDG